jgi:hypothetical protein
MSRVNVPVRSATVAFFAAPRGVFGRTLGGGTILCRLEQDHSVLPAFVLQENGYTLDPRSILDASQAAALGGHVFHFGNRKEAEVLFRVVIRGRSRVVPRHAHVDPR